MPSERATRSAASRMRSSSILQLSAAPGTDLKTCNRPVICEPPCAQQKSGLSPTKSRVRLRPCQYSHPFLQKQAAEGRIIPSTKPRIIELRGGQAMLLKIARHLAKVRNAAEGMVKSRVKFYSGGGTFFYSIQVRYF